MNSPGRITECRVVTVAVTADAGVNEVSVSWDWQTRGFQRVISWDAFQQAAVSGAMMFGHDEQRMQAVFAADSHEKIVAVAIAIRNALEYNRHIGAKCFNMSWAF